VDLIVKNEDGIEDHTVINLKTFHIDFSGNPFDMRMFVSTPVSDPNIDGAIKGTIDLGSMKNIVPLEDMSMNGTITANLEMKGKMSSIDNEQYEDFHAVGELGITNFDYTSTDLPQGMKISESSMTLSPQFVELKSFNASIGKSDLHMDGKIENLLAYYFRDELLKGGFNFSSALLDLNEFLTDEESSEATEATAETSEDMEAVEIPKNIDFTLSTSITKLLYDKLEIADVKGNVLIREGVAKMDGLSMNMLDGNMVMNGSYSTADITKPSVDFNMNMTGFDIRKTFDAFNTVQQVAPIAEKCTGKFSMSLAFTSVLKPDMEPEMNTVNGNGRFQTKTVVVDNTSVFNKIGEYLKTDKFNKINLTDVDFTFKIVDGNITVDPFESKFSKSKAVFGGSQSIDQSLAYNINFKVPSSEFGSAANQVVNNLFSQAGQAGVNVSMPEIIDFNAKIGGTILEPVVSVDLKDQAMNVVDDIKEQVKDKINEEVDKAKAEAIKKAEAEAARLLAEADKKGKELIAAAEKTAAGIKSTAKTSADKIRSEANANADKIIKEAGNNPIKKKVAEESAKKIREEGEKQATNVEKEAAKKADDTVNAAKKESDNLKKTAKTEGDKLIEKAKNS
ncbi:MAG: AsmA-like C-terminal region-containing protein, partial [Bacteroidota bacterium]